LLNRILILFAVWQNPQSEIYLICAGFLYTETGGRRRDRR